MQQKLNKSCVYYYLSQEIITTHPTSGSIIQILYLAFTLKSFHTGAYKVFTLIAARYKTFWPFPRHSLKISLSYFIFKLWYGILLSGIDIEPLLIKVIFCSRF